MCFPRSVRGLGFRVWGLGFRVGLLESGFELLGAFGGPMWLSKRLASEKLSTVFIFASLLVYVVSHQQPHSVLSLITEFVCFIGLCTRKLYIGVELNKVVACGFLPQALESSSPLPQFSSEALYRRLVSMP